MLAEEVEKSTLDAGQLSRRRPRFSLLTLLLVVTIVALAVGLVVVGRNNRRLDARNEALEAENRRLRDEVGELSIEDPRKLHAIRVSNGEELEWAWRVWIPEGRTYRLRYVDGQVPAAGYPQQLGGTITLHESGEQVIRYVIRRDPVSGQFHGSLQTRSASVGKDEHDWVEWGSRSSTTGGVGKTTQTYPPGQLVELCRLRVSQEDLNTEGPTAGFLIWLEPVK